MRLIYRMKAPRPWILSLALLPALVWGEAGIESKLKEAIQLTNQGRHEQALAILRPLSQQQPNDARIFLSLGLVHHTLGNVEQAIAAFEKLIALKPSDEGYYSLGLLYEAMALREPPGKVWLNKAFQAWEKFLKLNPADAKRVETAHRHLERLLQELRP